MSKSKQTAVDWLIEALGEFFPHGVGGIELVVKQAREMEKQQMIESYREGRTDQQAKKPSRFYNRTSEQYYNETFGK